VVFLVVVVSAVSVDQNPGGSDGLSARVQLGPLIVSVTESGEVEARDRKVISNELRWPVVILEVVDEGERVEEGQTIVQFECKELIEAIERQELEVTAAENNYIQAKQNLQLKKEEMDNRVLKAQRALDDAVEDRDLYTEHDYPIQFAERDNGVKIAEQKLMLAEERLAFKKHVNEMPDLESPFSENDIRAEELEVEQLRNSLSKARLELAKLKDYEHKRKLSELSEGIADAKLALRRAELERENEILMAEANEHAKKRTYEMRKDKLDELREDEKKLIVKAERTGLVVYDTARRRWDAQVRVAKGEQISPRQQIMVIPDMTSLQVTTKVYEAIIDQVQVGLPAFVRLDSRPDEHLKGKVSRVAPLPDSQNRWLNPGVKVFEVTVDFVGEAKDLKPGMTAEVELVLAELENVLSVPIAAIFTEQGRTVCYRTKGGECERVEVKVGRMNDRRVEIASGLSRGDEVMLVRPAHVERIEEEVSPEVAQEGLPRGPELATADVDAPGGPESRPAGRATSRPSGERARRERGDHPRGNRPPGGRRRGSGGGGRRGGGTPRGG